MNRIAPGTSELYIANSDGSDERKLLGNSSDFDYHATFSQDGQWITFTTERNGDGNSVGVFRYSEQHQAANSTCRIYIAFGQTDQI
jgi:Tol biopolymer transport system component